MTIKDRLHQLVEELDAEDVPVVEQLLQRLIESSVAPTYTLFDAPTDDEPETAEERAAAARAYEDINVGRVVSLEEVKREFGL